MEVEEARKILEPEFAIIPDEQLQEMIDQMQSLASYLSDQYLMGKLGTPESKVQELQKPLRNDEWHSKNKLFKKMGLNERVKRHIDHVANCECRKMPDSIKKEIQKRCG